MNFGNGASMGETRASRARASALERLAELTKRRDELKTTRRFLKGRLNTVGTDLVETELEMRRLMKAAYGIDVPIPTRHEISTSLEHDDNLGAAESMQSSAESYEDVLVEETANESASVAVSKPESLDVLPARTETKPPLSPREPELSKTNRIRKELPCFTKTHQKRAHMIGVIAKAIGDLGGAPVLRELYAEIRKTMPGIKDDKIRGYLDRYEQFVYGADRRWHFVAGIPLLSSRERKVQRYREDLAESLMLRGGSARVCELLEDMQARYGVDKYTIWKLNNHLRTGPFSRMGHGVWCLDGFRPEGLESAAIHLSEDFPEPSRSEWRRMLRGSRQKKVWRDIQIVRKAIDTLEKMERAGRGNGATRAAITKVVMAYDPHFAASKVTAILWERDHFVSIRQNRTWRYVDGPPPHSKREMEVHQRLEAIHEALVELGGEGRLKEIIELSSSKLKGGMSKSDVIRYLHVGPHERTGQRGWWRLLSDE
jgi:hypothetical protein